MFINLTLLESIILQLPNYVFVKDKNLVYRLCNLNFAKVVGLDHPKDIIGKTDYDMPWGKYTADIYLEEDRMVLQTGKPMPDREVKMVTPEGEKIISVSKSPLYDQNSELIGILGIYTDITERKQAQEREKQALAQVAKTEAELRQAVMVLSGSIVHDLRTPIMIINMDIYPLKRHLPVLIESYHKVRAANLLPDEHEEIDKRQLRAIEKTCNGIEETTRLMSNFIDSTLKTLSKVLSKELTQEDLVSCAMWRCIDDTLNRYPFVGNQRDLVKWNRGTFDFMGNQVLMIRVLTNLLKNALQQIEKNGHGEIFISMEENDSFNILRFKDTAGGAPPEVVDHLFEGYRTTKEEGTGVGLAFCKLVMNSFGGDIVCNSVYGDYIEFVMTFKKLEEVMNNK